MRENNKKIKKERKLTHPQVSKVVLQVEWELFHSMNWILNPFCGRMNQEWNNYWISTPNHKETKKKEQGNKREITSMLKVKVVQVQLGLFLQSSSIPRY